MKKIRVGIIARPIEQRTSGSGSHLEQLVKAIAAIENHDLDITLIRYGDTPLKIPGVTHELKISRNPILASIKLMAKKFDLIHYSPLTILSPVWV